MTVLSKACANINKEDFTGTCITIPNQENGMILL